MNQMISPLMTQVMSPMLVSIETASTAAYIVAALLFILALAGLSHHETAKVGNTFGIFGMTIALVATIALAFDNDMDGLAVALLVAAMAIGAVIGIWRSRVVEMTGMPELIALLHSFVGLAAVLVGWNGYLEVEDDPDSHHATVLAAQDLLGVHSAEVFIGVFIGAVTFTGSIVAFLKLSARMSSTPMVLPGKNLLNLGALAAFAGLTVWFVIDPQLWLLVLVTLVALALGLHLVASIGGGDMPVVVSMLNSYSGWAAAASGFLLENDLLIVTGALVGSSGAYLSYIMCQAMNRSFISVIAGGFGIAAPVLGRRGLRRAPGGPVRRGSRRARQRLVGHHHARLRHGGGAGPVPRRRAHREAAGAGHRRTVRHPPGRRAPARPHERAAGRGEGALRHRARDGRDQRGLPGDRRRPRHRRQRHRQPRRRRGPDQPDRRHAGARGLERLTR